MKLVPKFLFAFIAFGIFSQIVAADSQEVSEPQYRGRNLGLWLEDYQNSIPRPEHDGDDKIHAAAKEAIQKIGTNAIPWLLIELSAKEPTTGDELPKNFTSGKAIGRRWRAALAFEVLGSKGTPAKPKLVELLNDKQTAYTAAIALGGLGDQAIPILKQALTNEHSCARESAARVLGLTFGKKAQSALPALKKCAREKDASVKGFATFALGQVASDPEDVLQILLENLHDANDSVRKNAEHALKRIDPTGANREKFEKRN